MIMLERTRQKVNQQNRRIVIFGKGESGKSYWIWKNLIPGLTSYILWDFTGEWPGKLKRVPVIENISDLLKCRSKKMIFSPSYTKDKNDLIRALRYIDNFFLIIDEAQNLMHSGFCPPEILEIVIQGRHKRNINFCIASQNPPAISRRVSSNAKEMLIFRATEPIYLSYFAKFVEVQKILDLDASRHEYLHLTI